MPTVSITPDKKLLINGQKLWAVGLYGVFYEGSLAPRPEITGDFMFRLPPLRWRWYIAQSSCTQKGTTPASGYSSIVNSFIQNGQLLAPLSCFAKSGGVPANDPGIFGWMLPDEPDLTECDGQSPSEIGNLYHTVKAYDTTHPVLLNVFGAVSEYINYTDIIIFDPYSVTNRPDDIDPGSSWIRADATIAHEWRHTGGSGAFSNGKNAESFTKPIWEGVQAYGLPYRGGILDVLSRLEIRILSWLPVTMNLGGIVYYTAIASEGDPDVGLFSNPLKLTQYAIQAQELRRLNNVLVMTTMGYSWYGKQDNSNQKVQITGSGLTRTFTYSPDISVSNYPKINWMLKGENGVPRYLIIINKDSASVGTINVKIPALSGSSGMIKLLVHETDASRPGGRLVSMYGGTFSDLLVGNAVHVYDLNPAGTPQPTSSPTPTPTPTPTSSPTPTPTVTPPPNCSQNVNERRIIGLGESFGDPDCHHIELLTIGDCLQNKCAVYRLLFGNNYIGTYDVNLSSKIEITDRGMRVGIEVNTIQGYTTADTTFTISPSSMPPPRFPVNIISVPAGAQVTVDSRVLGLERVKVKL